MEIKIDRKKPIEAVVSFNKPLSYYEIIKLVRKAIIKCNGILRERWKKIPFFKRIFTSSDFYCFDYDMHYYFSHDGTSPMKRGGPYLLNPEEFPDVKYETRYLMSIIGLKDMRLYFNVIPGIAQEYQFGTEMSEYETVSCITIKANMKSNLHWKKRQAQFLSTLVPIIERYNQEKK